MTSPRETLKARIELVRRALEVDGYRAFPCRVCQRAGAVATHDLHEVLREVLALLDEEQRLDENFAAIMNHVPEEED